MGAVILSEVVGAKRRQRSRRTQLSRSKQQRFREFSTARPRHVQMPFRALVAACISGSFDCVAAALRAAATALRMTRLLVNWLNAEC